MLQVYRYSKQSVVYQGGEGKWGQAPWDAGLVGASTHFLQSFKNAF